MRVQKRIYVWTCSERVYLILFHILHPITCLSWHVYTYNVSCKHVQYVYLTLCLSEYTFVCIGMCISIHQSIYLDTYLLVHLTLDGHAKLPEFRRTQLALARHLLPPSLQRFEPAPAEPARGWPGPAARLQAATSWSRAADVE